MDETTIPNYEYLTIGGSKKFEGHNGKRKTHFILPQDWDKAMEYVKNFWEPEFKVGDLVVVLDTENVRSYSQGAVGYIFKLSDKETCLFSEFLKGNYKACVDAENKHYVNYYISDLRHATPEEIEDYNNPKLPIINGYDGKIEGKHVVYGCTKVSLEWFKNPFNSQIKSMVLSSGVEINEEQMNQIRKVVNAKTK